MAHLSSCYFCGVAVDEPLETYELPAAGEETTITLCQTCRYKLDAILDALDTRSTEPILAETKVRLQDRQGPPHRTADADSDASANTEQTDEAVDDTAIDTADADNESAEQATQEAESAVFAEGLEEELLAEIDADSETAEAAESPRGDDPPTRHTDSADNASADEPATPDATASDGAETPADIDPNILRADEIATGEADIEDVLDDSALSDPPAEESDTATPEESASETERLTADAATEESVADTDDTVTDEDATDRRKAASGFEFDTDEPPAETDTTLQEQMQPDIPEEFDSDDDEAARGDADPAPSADDAVSEPTDSASTGPDETTNEPSRVDDSTESTHTEGGRRTSISALEYNRVMRLLQNREFPVDRNEIETVAASAYDLSEAECAEVIDIAVDRELLIEEGAQLRKPE